jgi:hypothetical protein
MLYTIKMNVNSHGSITVIGRGAHDSPLYQSWLRITVELLGGSPMVQHMLSYIHQEVQDKVKSKIVLPLWETAEYMNNNNSEIVTALAIEYHFRFPATTATDDAETDDDEDELIQPNKQLPIFQTIFQSL